MVPTKLFWLSLWLLAGCEGKRESPRALPVALPSAGADVTPPPGLYVELFHRRPVPPGTETNIDRAETRRTQRPADPGALRTLGLAYYAGGGYEAAERALTAVVQKSPTDTVAWLYLGYCHMALGNYPEALAALGHVDSAESALQQGNVFFQALRKDEDAERYYRAAVKMAPREGEPLLALGLLLASQGRRNEARARLVAARERLPAGPLHETVNKALARLR